MKPTKRDIAQETLDEEEHIRRTRARAEDAIRAYLGRRIRAEFRRLRPRYRALSKIIFGNGTFSIQFAEGSEFEDLHPENLPAEMQHLVRLCELTDGYADDVKA